VETSQNTELVNALSSQFLC